MESPQKVSRGVAILVISEGNVGNIINLEDDMSGKGDQNTNNWVKRLLIEKVWTFTHTVEVEFSLLRNRGERDVWISNLKGF